MQKQKSNIDTIIDLHKCYLETFGSRAGSLVLDDLKNRCYHNRSTFNENPNITNYNVGMNAVLMHIINMLDEKHIESLKEITNARPSISAGPNHIG